MKGGVSMRLDSVNKPPLLQLVPEPKAKEEKGLSVNQSTNVQDSGLSSPGDQRLSQIAQIVTWIKKKRSGGQKRGDTSKAIKAYSKTNKASVAEQENFHRLDIKG